MPQKCDWTERESLWSRLGALHTGIEYWPIRPADEIYNAKGISANKMIMVLEA
jgi:hypothetical protein